MKIFKYFKFTLLCILLIFYLCFFTPPKTNLDYLPNFDKFVHFSMYAGTLAIFWIEYGISYKKIKAISNKKLFGLCFILPILMGGIIEILQAYCTGGRRSGDLWDFLADSTGVVIAFFLGKTILKKLLARNIDK